MFIRNNWYVAAWAEEVEGESMLPRILLDQPVVLFRTQDGRVSALEDRCCHRGLPLSMGRIIDDRIQCGYHGLEYDTSGDCVRVPGQDRIPERAKVRSFPVVEKNRLIWIWMGAPTLADPDRIVDFEWHDAADWFWKPGYKKVRCHHMMLPDNLLDLSHVGYVHTDTLGGDPDDHSAATLAVERSEDHVKVTRVMRATKPGPFHMKYGGFRGAVDRYQIIEFSPGWVLIHSGMTDAGALDEQVQVRPGAFNLAKEGFNGITPETEHTTHYFFSMAHQYAGGKPEVVDAVAEDIVAAFEEDARVIEAQYASVQRDPTRALMELRVDAGGVHARRIVSARLAAEHQEDDSAEEGAWVQARRG